MNITIALIWLFVLAVGAVGCIPYLVWLILTGIRKRWRKLGVQIAAPILLFTALVLVTRLIDYAGHRAHLRNVYDTSVVFESPIFEYHSERSFNGDGYSIDVYKLPDSIRARFKDPTGRLLSEFPKKPKYREHWQTEHWREAPVDPTFTDHLSFALSSYDSNRATGLKEQFDNIRSSLIRNGTFYACFKHDPGNYPGNIDMYIVDLRNGLVYQINHNT